MRRLILVGGGHAHLFVLRKLAQFRRDDIEVTLVSPSAWQYYSGMLPGWMAGHYQLEECRINLRAQASVAGADFIEQAIIGIHADQRYVCLSDGRYLHYDLVSLDVGSETDCTSLAGSGKRLLPVKPMLEFQHAWIEIMNVMRHKTDYRLLVIGGGAAGVEIALAASHLFRQTNPGNRIILVAGESAPLPSHSNGVRIRIVKALQHAGVELIQQRAVGTEDGVLLSDGRHIKADRVIAATGARAPVWLTLSGLALNPHGFIAVDAFHRSLSHAEVFAAGDVSARNDVKLAQSGVHAVRAGPVLADNLLNALDAKPLRTYNPRRHSLYLLACGNRRAVASWGPLSAEGAWVWRWKNAIDRRFIARFS